jgi:hypothetical protein
MSDVPSSDQNPSGQRESIDLSQHHQRSLDRLGNRGSNLESNRPFSSGLERAGQSQAKGKTKRNRSGCPKPKKIVKFVLCLLNAKDTLKVRNHLGLPDEIAGDSPGGDCPRTGCPHCQVEVDALRLAFKKSLGKLFVTHK